MTDILDDLTHKKEGQISQKRGHGQLGFWEYQLYICLSLTSYHLHSTPNLPQATFPQEPPYPWMVTKMVMVNSAGPFRVDGQGGVIINDFPGDVVGVGGGILGQDGYD